MTPAEAAKILELPAEATSEQVEARFLDLRRKLEDKIAKAPTPGLQAKYRESLTEITAAFETLTLAADSSTLPVLKKEAGDRRPEAGAAADAPRGSDSGLPSPVSGLPPAKRAKSGGMEFILVSVIAIAVLGAGGWWVMKTRAENAEKARLAAEAKVEAERKAATEKAEAERKAAAEKAEAARLAEEKRRAEEERDRLLTQLRSDYVALNVRLDALLADEIAAGRELSELKSQEREAIRDAKGNLGPNVRLLSSRVRALESFALWLRTSLASHPARVARAQIDELLQARAVHEAKPALVGYRDAIEQLRQQIDEARRAAVVVGSLQLEATIPGTTWKVIDAVGAELTGTTPAVVNDLALGTATVIFQRPRWPEQRQRVEIKRERVAAAQADYRPARFKLTITPASALVMIEEGRRIDETTWELDPGKHLIEIEHPDFAPQLVTVNVAPGESITRDIVLDQNMTRSLLPLIYERFRQVPPDEAVYYAYSLAHSLDATDARSLIRELLDWRLQKGPRNFDLIEEHLPVRALKLNLKSEALALVDWLDQLELSGVRKLPDSSYTDSVSLTIRLARLAAVRIAAGDRDGLARYFDRMVASQKKNQGAYFPTQAYHEAAIYSDVALTLSRLGAHEQARLYLDRATRSGAAVDSYKLNMIHDAEALAALESGDLAKCLALLRAATAGDEKLVSYGTYSSAIRTAKRLGRNDAVAAFIDFVNGLEDKGRFSASVWDRNSYNKEAFEHDYTAKREQLKRDRLELFKAARANPDPLKSLEALVDLHGQHEYYRLDESQ